MARTAYPLFQLSSRILTVDILNSKTRKDDDKVPYLVRPLYRVKCHLGITIGELNEYIC